MARLTKSQVFLNLIQQLKIRTPAPAVIPFRLNKPQHMIWSKIAPKLDAGERVWVIILKARREGCCLSPQTRILMKDLQWMPIESVNAGDEVVACDEFPPGGRGAGRKLRPSVVIAKRVIVSSAIRITMSNRETLIATPEHRFLCKKRGGVDTTWRHVNDMRIGDEIRWITKPWALPEYEDGWFGGLLDGEGSLRARECGGSEIKVTQLPGPVLDRAKRYLSSRGYSHYEGVRYRNPGSDGRTLHNDGFRRRPIGDLTLTRINEIFQLIGQTRPSRFLARGSSWWDGKELPGKGSGEGWATIEKMELLNLHQPMIDLQTTTGTFIAEGFVSHNSTLSEALMFIWTATQPLVRSLVIAHDFDAAKKVWEMSQRFLTDGPYRHIGKMQEHSIRFGDSILEVDTAASPHSRRGSDTTCCHFCLSGESEVMLADGHSVHIQDVQVGQRVMTETGAIAKVRAISARPVSEVCADHVGYHVQPWLSDRGITLTQDHKVLTARGWVPAMDLRLTDEVGYPIPRLTEQMTRLRVEWEHGDRPQGGGSRPTVGTFALTRETGFFVGYYLAEGCIKRQHKTPHHPSAIELASHENERAFAERAKKAVEGFVTSSHVAVRPGSYSMLTTLYGASLSQFVYEQFGMTDSKRIPEWVFDAPRDFVFGLVEGYLSGDGSKGMPHAQGYTDPKISVTSVRKHLLIQLRRCMAALGYGWMSLYCRNSTTFRDSRGWTNRPAWVAGLHGHAAIRLRRDMGWPVPDDSPVTTTRRQQTQKYRLGGSMVWVKLKAITRRPLDMVYDLEVDHDDHSFETVAGVVANSELAFWKHEEALLATIQTLPKPPIQSLCIIESTANGMVDDGEQFYNEWQRAVAGDSGFTPIFLSWLDFPDYQIPGTIVDDLDDDERELVKVFHVTPEQLAWRRYAINDLCQGDLDKFSQEYPVTPEAAFVQSGLPFFASRELMWIRPHLAKGRRYRVDVEGRLTEDPQGYIEIWKLPDPRYRYVVGADSSMGLEEVGSKSRSRSAGEVICMETMEQVAEYDAVSAPHIMSRHLAGIGRLYNRALLCPEVTASGGGGGRELIVYLTKDLGYYDLHIWRHADHIRRSQGQMWGWETNAKTRPRMIARIREVINEQSAIIHSEKLLKQLSAFGESDSGKMEALAGHDDLLFAWGIALMSRSENYFTPVNQLVTPAMPDFRDLGIRMQDGYDATTLASKHLGKVFGPQPQVEKHWLEY